MGHRVQVPRQRHPRVPLEARVVCRSGASTSWTSLNVSESGLFVQGSPILAPGTEVEVSVLLPEGSECVEVRGRARVVWNNHPQASAPVPNHPVGMGMQLVDLEQRDREVLQSHVARLLNDCLEELARYREQNVEAHPTGSTLERASDHAESTRVPTDGDAESADVHVSGLFRRAFGWLGSSDVAILGTICLCMSVAFAVVTWTLPWGSQLAVPDDAIAVVPASSDERERASQTSAKHATVLMEATRQVQRGEYALAVETCRAVLRRDPNSADAYRILATAQLFLGDRRQACESFERYLHLAPGAPDAAKVREGLKTCAE